MQLFYKQLTFIFNILCDCLNLQALECLQWFLRYLQKLLLFSNLKVPFIGLVAVCMLFIKTSKCFTVHCSFTLPVGARAVIPVSEGSDGGHC